MLAEYHASTDDRVVSLPLETNSTIFETSYFSVGQENLQNNKDEFRNLQTMLDHISNIINSENRKGMLSDMKTEFEHIIQSTDINVLQEYLHNGTKVYYLFSEGHPFLCCFCLIVYHVLVSSENENSTQILNVIKSQLLKIQEYDFEFDLDYIFQLYLDVYYTDNPNEIFTNIHSIWKCIKSTELNLKLVYCKNLIEAKDYKTLIQLIHHHADNLIESFEENGHEQYYRPIATMVLLHVLHYQDMVSHGLTTYLMILCNREYGPMSKFILDIWLICPHSQFVHKLTSGIATLSLKYDDDTVNDFRKLIYKCYCTVRHDCRNEKYRNITKYRDHFTFIASMEAEEEMKKLTSLTNLLLLLTLLLIASGGHHKSAELKKYLSLKYEYRDSILYLLWCSGDVEINPGPTLSTLGKVPDSVKERNWIYEMCSMLLRLLKYRSIDIRIDGLWKEKPLDWPVDSHFYDPRNKPKDKGYSIKTDRKLLENLEEQCNRKGFLKDLSKFDDEHTKSKVRQYKMEITAWKNNRTELFTLYTLRQEQDTLRAAKLSLHKYKNDSELHKGISDLGVDIIFDTDDVTSISSEVYTDIVRDIAITFCRIGKRLSPLEKSDGIWKMQPSEWNPNHSYYSPCNAGKRKEKGQDQKLVDNLLTYCESKNVTIPAELQPLLKAWKQRNTSAITKYYTVWSKTAIINHSLKYLELEGLLEKCHVHESLKQIGLILDTQYWRCPSPKKVTSTDNDDKSQDSGFSDTSHSSHCSDSQTANLTNSSPKVLSFHKIEDNQVAKLTNSTNANLNATDDSSCGIDSHTNEHLCYTKFYLDNQWKELSNQTCFKSDKANFSILTSKAHPEHDVLHYPVLSVDSTNSKQKGNYKKISQNTSKRKRPNEDESYSDLKRPYISEVDLPLSVASSSSMNCDAETKINDKNNKITSDQYVDNIVNLLDELDQDYSSTAGKASIQESSSTTDQSSDVCNELPEYVQLYIDTVQNSYNPDDTLNIDIEQFIEEQDMDLS